MERQLYLLKLGTSCRVPNSRETNRRGGGGEKEVVLIIQIGTLQLELSVLFIDMLFDLIFYVILGSFRMAIIWT
jgi:hypothetical protein